MKNHSSSKSNSLLSSNRSLVNPIRSLTPESLVRLLDAFHAGHIRNTTLMWDSIERRDDVLAGVISKRKKSVSRLDWEIITLDDSPEAHSQKTALHFFYSNLTASHAIDQNETGNISLLLKQMMDSVAKKYAVHEIIYEPQSINNTPFLTATFRFIPLWHFDNTQGRLRFIDPENASNPIPLDPGSWLISTGDGLMEACSIAYLFKHLPLRDWLIYCERNGMPGVKAITAAPPNSPEWHAVCKAVESFSSEFHAVMSPGCDLHPIDLSSRGEPPYRDLIDRMDRAMISLWRGSDLSTLSSSNGNGASLQQSETDLLEDDDARHLSEILNQQVDKFVLQELFPNSPIKAYFHIKSKERRDRIQDLNIYKTLLDLGVPISIQSLYQKFGIPTPSPSEPTLCSYNNTKSQIKLDK